MEKVKHVFAVIYYNFTLQNVVPGWIRGSVNQCLAFLLIITGGICIVSAMRKAPVKSWMTVQAGRTPTKMHKLGMYAAPVAAVGMIISTLSAIVWGILASNFAPDIIQGSNFGISCLSFIFVVLIMIISAAAASALSVRGMKYMHIS